MAKTIFLTGSTGNIGSRLVIDILKKEPDSRLILLIRGKDRTQASLRLFNILNRLEPDLDYYDAGRRIKIIAGDITMDNLGLTEVQIDHLGREITHIIHGAAATKFRISQSRAAMINIEGTRRMLKFAVDIMKYGKLERFAYISTAYVCGDQDGLIKEEMVKGNPDFTNNYERSKFLAEQEVQTKSSILPVVIFRPSIVVGDSIHGRIAGFNVLYTPISMIWKGTLRFIPGFSDTRLDVVPVDYVSEAIRTITLNYKCSSGRIFHLTAGFKNSLSVGQIVNTAIRIRQARTGLAFHVRFVNPRLLNLVRRLKCKKSNRLAEVVDLFVPYIAREFRFDDSNTREALEGSAVTLRSFSEYITPVMDYFHQIQYSRLIRLVA